jgi:hypothetical protein
MRANRSQRPSFTLLRPIVVALALVFSAGAARAAAGSAPAPAPTPPPAWPPPMAPVPDAPPPDAPPAVPESNVAQPSAQAPASAPAGSEANFPTGLVERLPSSAYPEPYIRGLYGSSLWLNMQGLQWPYYPRIGVGISGYGWIDSDYKKTRIGDPGQSDHTTKFFQQGRFLLRVTPTYSNGTWFVQAQGEIVANKDQLDTQQGQQVVDAEDVWVRTGVWQKWDVTFGRFEAFEVYHLGMGLDLNTDERIGAYDASHSPPALYGATFLFYRPSGPGNIAGHIYPTKYLRFEILGQWGNDNFLNYVGARPAGIFDVGWLKVKAAGEYLWGTSQDPSPSQHNETRRRGFAGSAQFVFAPWVEFGPNIGYAITDIFTPASSDPNTGLSGNELSYGGFVNARVIPNMLVGAGFNYANFSNLHFNSATGQNDTSTNTQYYLAVQYLVYNQLFVKLVGGYAKSHFDYSFSNMAPYDDDMFSVRLRVMYLY